MSRIVILGGTELLRTRTERSLARYGLVAERARDELELASALRDDDARVWVLRAGAWIDAIVDVPSSATKKPLVALGALRGDAMWDALLARTRGEIDRAIEFVEEPPRVASVVIESPHALRAALASRAFDDAVWALARSTDVRAVRAHDLDVGFDERLRACVVVTALRRGGAERIALDVSRGLRERGVAVRFIVMGARSAGREDAASYAPPDDALFARDLAPRVADVVASVSRVAYAFGADVIHAHLLDASDVRALAALGPPVVVTVHNDRARWPRGFDAVACTEAALTLGCSRRVTNALVASSFARVRVAPNCVDEARACGGDRARTRRALEVPDDALLALCLANPRPQKRLELAVHAIAALRETRDARLVIVGDALPGEEGDAATRALASAITDAKMDGFVRVIPAHRDVRDLFAAADVLLTTSTYEGMSVAQLEALAASVPVVTTDVGGATMLSRAHENFVTSNASPSDLARAVDAASRGARPKLATAFSIRAAAARHERALRGAALFDRTSDGLVLVINNFSTGGAQASARRLLRELHARGHRVAAAVLQEQARFPTRWRDDLSRDVPVFVAPHRNDPPASAATVCDFVRARRAATVVFWNAMTSHKLRIADELVGVRLFDVSPGEMYFSALAKWFEKPEEDLPYFTTREYGALLEGVVVKFAAEAARARDVLGAPVHVVPNGVPLGPARTRVRSRGRFVVGTLARISPDKKLGELLDATRELARTVSNFELRFAGRVERGAESYAESLRENARGLPVTFVGEVDASAFLDDLDAFAMISEPEGCPNALLEAMSASLPVAATSVGGACEAITDGETGLLVPRGDGRALGAALARIARDELLAARLAANAFSRIRERYDVARMTRDYESLFFTTR